MADDYWAIARTGEHPARAREADYIGRRLGPEVCQAFPSRTEICASYRFLRLLVVKDDPAPRWEIVRFQGGGDDKRTDDDSEGIYVELLAEDARTPLVDFIREVAASSDANEAGAGAKALRVYEDYRRAFRKPGT